MATITLEIWKTDDGVHLEQPAADSLSEEIQFDPDAACRICGEAVLNLSQSGSDVCPWCDGNVNRPKMLDYQEEAIKREFIQKYAK